MDGFGDRLKEAFGGATNAEIAEKMGVSEGAVGNYARGRVPDAEKLVKISNITKRSVDWLLTGKNHENSPPKLDIINLIEARVRELIKSELSSLEISVDKQGTMKFAGKEEVKTTKMHFPLTVNKEPKDVKIYKQEPNLRKKI